MNDNTQSKIQDPIAKNIESANIAGQSLFRPNYLALDYKARRWALDDNGSKGRLGPPSVSWLLSYNQSR